MRRLFQSTAYNLMVFMTDSADHIAGKTGLTLTITASKDGAAFASITPTVTELATGWYKLALTTSHTDTLGDLSLHITGTAADPTDMSVQIILAVPVVNVTQWLGTAAATPTVAGVPEVDATHWLGAAAPAMTGDAFARIGATGSGLTSLASQASVNTVDDFLDTEIAALTSTLGAAGAGLTAIPWNAAWDAEVQSEATDALSAYDPPTKAELDSAVAPLATAAALDAVDNFLDTEIAAILADTDELQLDWVNGGRLDLILDARSSQASVDDLPTNAELTTALGTADDAVLAAVAAQNNLSQANIRTAVGLASANLDTQLADLPTNAELPGMVWVDPIIRTLTAGTNIALAKGVGVTGFNDITAAEVKTAIEASGSVIDFIRDVLEGDLFIDTATTPWQLKIRLKGTATALITKNLYNTAGVDITSATVPVGRHTEPA